MAARVCCWADTVHALPEQATPVSRSGNQHRLLPLMCVLDKDSAARARAEARFKLREFHKADAPVRDYREAQRPTLERMREQRAKRLAYEAQLARER